MLDEKYNLHCWLSPVTDIWRGFGWSFVLKKKQIIAWKLILAVWLFLEKQSQLSSLCSLC